MNKIITKTAFVIGFTVFSFVPVFANNEPNGTPTNNVQDTQKAAQYFEDELSFKTNPYFVSKVVKDKMPNMTIVDVRSAEAFAKGHVPGAINLPGEKFNSFDGSETEFPGLRKDGFNIVYCYTPTCNAAQKAAKKFASVGYPVKEMIGGFDEWTAKKYPVETGAAK